MKKGITYFLKLFFGLGLLLYLIFFKTKPEILFGLVRKINWPVAILAFSLHAVGLLISAIRWKLLLDDRGSRYSVTTLIQYYLVGTFFSHFLPSRFGGDVARMADTRHIREGLAGSFAVIVYERMSGIAALLAFALISSLVKFGFIKEIPVIYLFLVANLLAMILLIWAWKKIPENFFIRFQRKPGWLSRVLNKLNLVHAIIRDFLTRKKLLRKVMIWAFLLQLNVIIHYYFIGQSLKTTAIPFLDYFFIIPILLFILSIPISINGIGVRDFVLIKFFGYYGYDASYAIGFSLLDLFFNLVLGILGGMFYIFRKK